MGDCEANIKWELPGQGKTPSNRAQRALELAVTCARDFDTSFGLCNKERECSVPQFDLKELTLSEKPTRIAGFYTEYQLVKARAFLSVDHGAFGEGKQHFAARSDGGFFCVKFLQRGIVEQDHAVNATTEMVLEAKILTSLASHPHISKIHGITSGGLKSMLATDTLGYFFITDNIQETLEERISAWRKNTAFEQKGGTSEITQRLEVALDIASALVYLHDRKLVFYVRPEKIGFDSRYKRIKLFCFGQARQEGMESHPRTVTQSDNIRTLAYTAPEVFCMAPSSCGTDVFGFAILLWEMMSLEEPFEGFDRAQHFDKVVREHARPLDIDEDWDPEIAAMLKDSWHPFKRPTMKSVLKTLETRLLFQGASNEIPEIARTIIKRSNSTGVLLDNRDSGNLMAVQMTTDSNEANLAQSKQDESEGSLSCSEVFENPAASPDSPKKPTKLESILHDKKAHSQVVKRSSSNASKATTGSTNSKNSKNSKGSKGSHGARYTEKRENTSRVRNLSKIYSGAKSLSHIPTDFLQHAFDEDKMSIKTANTELISATSCSDCSTGGDHEVGTVYGEDELVESLMSQSHSSEITLSPRSALNSNSFDCPSQRRVASPVKRRSASRGRALNPQTPRRNCRRSKSSGRLSVKKSKSVGNVLGTFEVVEWSPKQVIDSPEQKKAAYRRSKSSGRLKKTTSSPHDRKVGSYRRSHSNAKLDINKAKAYASQEIHVDFSCPFSDAFAEKPKLARSKSRSNTVVRRVASKSASSKELGSAGNQMVKTQSTRFKMLPQNATPKRVTRTLTRHKSVNGGGEDVASQILSREQESFERAQNAIRQRGIQRTASDDSALLTRTRKACMGDVKNGDFDLFSENQNKSVSNIMLKQLSESLEKSSPIREKNAQVPRRHFSPSKKVLGGILRRGASTRDAKNANEISKTEAATLVKTPRNLTRRNSFVMDLVGEQSFRDITLKPAGRQLSMSHVQDGVESP